MNTRPSEQTYGTLHFDDVSVTSYSSVTPDCDVTAQDGYSSVRYLEASRGSNQGTDYSVLHQTEPRGKFGTAYATAARAGGVDHSLYAELQLH